MKPERSSRRIDGMTHARARMFEFNVPEGLANLDTSGSDPAELLSLVVGILGDEAARIADLEMDRADSVGRILPEEPLALRFAAAFLHAYVSSRYGEQLATELLTLSGAGYYLCDLAGSAGVLIREAAVSGQPINQWDGLLRWLLSIERPAVPELANSTYTPFLSTLATALQAYFTEGTRREDVVSVANALRQTAYVSGTARDLLYADPLLLQPSLESDFCNAARHVLPPYSNLTPGLWAEPFAKPSFMQELWPSQHVFGERGILQASLGCDSDADERRKDARDRTDYPERFLLRARAPGDCGRALSGSMHRDHGGSKGSIQGRARPIERALRRFARGLLGFAETVV